MLSHLTKSLITIFMTLRTITIVSSSNTETRHNSLRKIVIGIDGGTESIRACCFDACTGHVVGKPCAVSYPTYHPKPGWAEQDPLDWYQNLGLAVRGAIGTLPDDDNEPTEISALTMDTTCCSVVALDEQYEPLRPCLLWMDQRSAPQTKYILEQCKGDPALAVNCGGQGPISAEWMTPKALWIRQNEPEIWNKAKTICEYQDYLNYKLTGVMCASSCNAASRWHWDGEKSISDEHNHHDSGGDENHPGRPLSLYKSLGIPELEKKLPQRCQPMGTVIGRLTEDAAAHLGLKQGLPIVQGGPDAFVGMVGLGCIHPGQLCLITGSSHLHCVVSSKPTTAPGTWGAYRGAPLPGINFAEGGQSSTGSIIRWAKSLLGNDFEYSALDEEAASIPPGSDGLVALETFQGSRTPITDPLARGALVGLTLSHTRGHVWRALMEAVCFGTRGCVEGLVAAGHTCEEIIIAGGATRSKLWLQMHADVTGIPVVVCEIPDAPLLGCAILASVGVGVHASVDDGVKAMVRTSMRIEPDPVAAALYDRFYKDVYCKLAEAVRPVVHAAHQVREELALPTAASELRGGNQDEQLKNPEQNIMVSPSLLACDWSEIRKEVHRCLEAGATRLHVDIFDGVFLNSPKALTFGPKMVEGIRKSCDSFEGGAQQAATLDAHVCVQGPHSYVDALAEAGLDRFIFQWEALSDLDAAVALAQGVHEAGMKCGVSINPSTPVDVLFPLLESGLIDTVDILAVEPGFGGQEFQSVALEKIKELRSWLEARHVNNVDIMVDGGVNSTTAAAILSAGANVLVAGTYLFRDNVGMAAAIDSLINR